jgi:hypothetical protein
VVVSEVESSAGSFGISNIRSWAHPESLEDMVKLVEKLMMNPPGSTKEPEGNPFVVHYELLVTWEARRMHVA